MVREPADGLREVFEDLRAAEAGAVPPFERVWAAAEARATRIAAPRRTTRLLWGAALAAAATVALLLARPARRPPLALSAWQSPTEFLLLVPGDAMLRSVPPLSASVVVVQPWWRGRAAP